MADEDRFKDNENGTLTDTKYNLTWTKEDSYQMRNKWCSWKGATNYIIWLNEQKFAGFDDWRLPKSQECRNLYDHECKNTDFDGDIVHIDYKFLFAPLLPLPIKTPPHLRRLIFPRFQ